MKREFDVLIERDEAGYLVASVPSLPGCHTQAKSFDKLLERIREAIELCLEEYGQDTHQSKFVGIQRVAVEA
jgi:predicted RNase H-like HicB family nuclease